MRRSPLLLTVLGVGIWGHPQLANAEPTTSSSPQSSSSTTQSSPIEPVSSFAPGQHPGSLPWGSSFVGVSWVGGGSRGLNTAIVESSGVLRASRWHVGFVLGHAPWLLHSHTRIENGYRLWGALAQRAVSPLGASHATLSMAFDTLRFSRTTTSTTTLELRLSTRVDLKLVAPELRSLFIDAEVGYAGRRALQNNSGVVDDIRLGQYGIGVGYYLGDPTTHGTELRVRYNADARSYCQAPPLLPDLAPPQGCLGLELAHFLSPSWGLRAQAEAGAGGVWVLGLHVLARAWSESAESNGLFDFGQ